MAAVTTNDRATVAWLLTPHSVDEFLDAYFEKKPLHISRNVPGYFDRYFNLDEMERVLYGTGLRTKDLHVFKEGTAIRPELYTEKPKDKYQENPPPPEVIDPDRASALFASGCTINLVSLDKFSISAAQLTRAMECVFRCGINPNVYLTPAGSQGFSVHYDTHDTLIVQIQGTKLWRIYSAPADLPLDHQTFNSKVHQPGDLQMELQLQPGDVLYIPRGYCHSAKANDELSLHVTFGLFPSRWIHVLTTALGNLAENDVRLRKNAAQGDAAAAIAELLPQLLDAEYLSKTLEGIESGFVAGRRNQLDGQLRQISALERLDADAVVARRDSLLYTVEEGEQNTKLNFSGKTLTLGKSAAAVIHALENVSSVRMSELLSQDPDALKTMRRLIQEGFAIQIFGPKEESGVIVA